jgi:DNA-binding protein HU-beta
MRKQDLVTTIARTSGLPEAKVSGVVTAVFDNIQSALVEGDEVAISGFGTFRAVTRPARTTRNPRSGEQMQVGPRRSAAFRPGASLKRALADSETS